MSGAKYEYKADGMRTDKVEGFNLSWQWTDKAHTSGFYDENQSQNLPTTRYFYDGQMAVEDDNTVVSQIEPVVTVMRYGIGARGIDFLAKSLDGGAETKGFPLYDGHGNMIATLARSGSSPYFGVADLRSYDVWGAVRSGSTTGDPKQRYCANLGHIQDDESGLVYMRARYYEPWSGRFVSQDPRFDGANWFLYARNNPVGFVDSTGAASIPLTILIFQGLAAIFIANALIITQYSFNAQDVAIATVSTAVAVALTGLASVFGTDQMEYRIIGGIVSGGLMVGLLYTARDMWMLGEMTASQALGQRTAARAAVMACFLYSASCFAVLKEMDWLAMSEDIFHMLSGLPRF